MTLTPIGSAVREWFGYIVLEELTTLEQRLEPLAKAEMFDAPLANEIRVAYAHIVAARIRAAELLEGQA